MLIDDPEQAMQYLVTHDALPRPTLGAGISTHLFNGGNHGLSTTSLLLSELEPGAGPRLHRHTYEEVFVVHEGQGAFTIAETTVEASAGDIVVIPAGLAHRFVNNGMTPLRVTAVHASDAVAIEWLE